MTDPIMKLGRLVQHDPRSLNFPVEAADTPVTSKTWKVFGSVLNQGNVGSCTGNAMAGAINAQPIHASGDKILRETNALDLYSLATQMDEFQNNTYYHPKVNGSAGVDEGSSGLGVSKAAQKLGYITSYQHAFSLDQVLQALMKGACICGTNWYESMFKPDANGEVTISGSVAGGHEYLLFGVDVDNELLWFRNSWSKSWGKDGTFCMSYATFSKLLSQKGDVILPIK